MRLTRSKILPLAAVGLIAAGGSAFTANNTTQTTAAAGYQSKVSGGFNVTNIEYKFGLLASNGDKITQVNFKLAPEDTTANGAAQARVKLASSGGYYKCTGSVDGVGTLGGTNVVSNWTCAITPNLAASAINTLDIAAVSQADSTAE